MVMVMEIMVVKRKYFVTPVVTGKTQTIYILHLCLDFAVADCKTVTYLYGKKHEVCRGDR